MALQSTQTALQRKLSKQLAELQEKLSRDVAPFTDVWPAFQYLRRAPGAQDDEGDAWRSFSPAS